MLRDTLKKIVALIAGRLLNNGKEINKES